MAKLAVDEVSLLATALFRRNAPVFARHDRPPTATLAHLFKHGVKIGRCLFNVRIIDLSDCVLVTAALARERHVLRPLSLKRAVLAPGMPDKCPLLFVGTHVARYRIQCMLDAFTQQSRVDGAPPVAHLLGTVDAILVQRARDLRMRTGIELYKGARGDCRRRNRHGGDRCHGFRCSSVRHTIHKYNKSSLFFERSI